MAAQFRKLREVTPISIAVLLLLLLPIALIVYKFVGGSYDLASLVPIRTYEVTVNIDFTGYGDSLRVQTFLPETDERTVISDLRPDSDLPKYRQIRRNENTLAVWSGPDVIGPHSASLNYQAFGRAVSYSIDAGIPLPDAATVRDNPYLKPTPEIQSGDPEIAELTSRLVPPQTDFAGALQSVFDYCLGLPTVSFKGTTDALTTLRLGEASCNGKSRLFVALSRHLGVPSRLVGGLILESTTKRTSHQWVEVLIGPYWVPFCPTNGHFASIPANYLRLYRGDEALFTHSRDINFNYSFRIRGRESIRGELVERSMGDPLNLLGIWETFRAAGIPLELLRVLLMIPLGALVLVVLRNIIGLNTFGTFLPVLVAIASRQTGLLWGLAVFVLVIFLIFLMRTFVIRLDLLHVPQMAILLSFSVIFVLALGATGVRSGFLNLAHISMFPIAILAITTERFSLMVEEEGILATAKVTLMTVIAIACCYSVMNAMAFQILFLTFPEFILVVMFFNIWLGRWVGLRVMEYWRFRRLIRMEGK